MSELMASVSIIHIVILIYENNIISGICVYKFSNAFVSY